MAYTLKSVRTDFKGGKNILASEVLQYIHAGATLAGDKFPAGLIEVGTLIARNVSTGKYEPYVDGGEGFDNFYILNEAHQHDGESDAITGAVLIAGSVYEAKLPVAPTAHFKEATQGNIFYVTHV